MKPRIGIFGGSFNPVHVGHLIMAQDALELLDLARVLFIPCNQPPHKDAKELAPAAQRVAMLEMAIDNNPDFEICDLELRRGGPNYTIDTIRQLQKIYPAYELIFIIGADSLLELQQWKEINKLLCRCRFVTFSRPGFEIKKINKKRLKLGVDAANTLLKNVLAAHQMNISSSDIRRRAAEGMSIRHLVPPAVERYIAEHNLYKTCQTISRR